MSGLVLRGSYGPLAVAPNDGVCRGDTANQRIHHIVPIRDSPLDFDTGFYGPLRAISADTYTMR